VPSSTRFAEVVSRSAVSTDRSIHIPTTPDPDPSKSSIVFVKQAAGLTCQDLIARQKQIFDAK
jgi:hypothetical protein